MMLDIGKKSYFEQNIVLTGQQNGTSDSDDDDDGDNFSTNAFTFDTSLESSDDKVSLSFHLTQGEEGIIVDLYNTPSIDKANQAYIDMDLKFTFLKSDGSASEYSFDIKEKKVLSSMSFGLLQHLEIPYSKTPFDKNTLLEEYKNDFDSVTIQCKGYYSLTKISENLKEKIDKKKEKLSGALPKMLQSGLYSDIVLVTATSGKEFSVHKNILAAFSPVFASLFSTDVMVKEENRLLVIDIDTATLELLLKFIYNEIRLSDFLTCPIELMKAAIKYEMTDLQNVLEEVLCLYMDQVKPEHVSKLHIFAFKNDFIRLSKESLQVCNQNLTQKKMCTDEEEKSFSIESILLKNESMQFDDFSGRLFMFSTTKKKYNIYGFTTKQFNLSFEKNYLLVKGFKGFKEKPFTVRLNLLKCLNNYKETSCTKGNLLFLIFAGTPEPKNTMYGDLTERELINLIITNTLPFITSVVLRSKSFSKTCDFYKHLMVRVQALQTTGNSNKNQLYDSEFSKINKICFKVRDLF